MATSDIEGPEVHSRPVGINSRGKRYYKDEVVRVADELIGLFESHGVGWSYPTSKNRPLPANRRHNYSRRFLQYMEDLRKLGEVPRVVAEALAEERRLGKSQYLPQVSVIRDRILDRRKRQ